MFNIIFQLVKQKQHLKKEGLHLLLIAQYHITKNKSVMIRNNLETTMTSLKQMEAITRKLQNLRNLFLLVCFNPQKIQMTNRYSQNLHNNLFARNTLYVFFKSQQQLNKYQSPSICLSMIKMFNLSKQARKFKEQFINLGNLMDDMHDG